MLRGPPAGAPSPRRPTWRRHAGDLPISEFLDGLLEAAQRQLPSEVQQRLHGRRQGTLVKLFADEPDIHFELWLHLSRARAELGLHFETRDAARNRRLLDYIADELGFLKAALGDAVEAELWDKGWTRVYLTCAIARLDRDEQARLTAAFAEFVEVLEPLRQEAVTAAEQK